jgi:hypothetical protein
MPAVHQIGPFYFQLQLFHSPTDFDLTLTWISNIVIIKYLDIQVLVGGRQDE